jgi:hypothetical protein
MNSLAMSASRLLFERLPIGENHALDNAAFLPDKVREQGPECG